MRASPIDLFRSLLMLMALALCVPAQGQMARPAPANNIAAELVAEGAARPGETVTLALLFTPQPGWHGYWSNPGDAGYGMELDWELPPGWEAGEPAYPVPERLLISGLMNHVYEGQYAVLVPLHVPAGAGAGAGAVPIAVDAEWLACTDQICVPERGRLAATLTVGTGPEDPRFDGWRAALPPPLDQPATFALADDALRIAIPLPAAMALADPHVFIEQAQLIDYPAAQAFYRDGDRLVIAIPRKGTAEGAERISGILKLDDAGGGIAFAAEPGAVALAGERISGGGAAAGAGASLWLLLGGALLGGLVLNLMPCVFPILSLKAMTLARAGESEAGARREGLAYTAGVVLACLALGGLLLLLRAGGSEIGWAFQLQEPGVVVVLLVLATAITANFAGVYELPALAITRSGGRSSAFATGLLAAFVATPCTGPFMAAALGAALILPPAQALLLFAALGLGLALPFLLLGFVPALRRMLPRPGPWMETFRRVLAVLMGLTALALLWLAWRLGGPWFALLGLGLSVVVVLLLVSWRKGGRGLAAGSLVAGALAVAVLPGAYDPPAGSGETLLAARDFSDAALADARGSGAPVFLYFTADWCLTCKVNESVAIEREGTRAAFEQAGVVTLRGDWTRRDPAITRFLTDHGAAGVPLYLWYPAGGEGQVLPQVLTPDSLAALARES